MQAAARKIISAAVDLHVPAAHSHNPLAEHGSRRTHPEASMHMHMIRSPGGQRRPNFRDTRLLIQCELRPDSTSVHRGRGLGGGDAACSLLRLHRRDTRQDVGRCSPSLLVRVCAHKSCDVGTACLSRGMEPLSQAGAARGCKFQGEGVRVACTKDASAHHMHKQAHFFRCSEPQKAS